MNSSRMGKWALACAMLCLTVFIAFMAWAEDQKPPEEQKAPEAPTESLTLSSDFLSQYIFRGAAQSKDSAVFQPSITGTWNGLSASVWSNIDTARHSNNPLMPLPDGQRGNALWSETDFTVSYTKELCKNFSVLIGNVFYALQVPISPFDQDEIYGGVSYTFPWLTVAFTTYGEVTHAVDVWFQLDLTKSVPVDMLCKGATLDFGASFGYLILFKDNNNLNQSAGFATPPPGSIGTYSNFHTAQLTADIKFPIGKYVTIAPKIGVWLPLSGAASDYLEANSLDSKSTHVYGGLNVTGTF